MENYTIEQTSISKIKIGDTILHNGEIKTISGNNIKHDSFMGHKQVQKINFNKFF
jgi:hypothetical protein